MALPEPISANLPAPTASAVRGTSPLTLVPAGTTDLWGILRPMFRSPRHAREHRAENGSQQGLPVPRLSLFAPQQK